MNARLMRGLWAWALLLFCTLVAAQVAVPPLATRVTDLTNTLSAPQRAALEQTLKDFETRKGAQLAVLIVPTTGAETIEQYAVRVIEAWKLGRKGVDDSVLLVIAKDDRRMRIEVGYGLEGALPDAGAKRIISEDITPRFKVGDYDGGVRAGVDRIIRVIEGEPLPAPAEKPMTSQGAEFALWAVLIGGVLLGGLLRLVFGRAVGACIAGGALGALAWFLSGLFFAGLIAGIVAFFITLMGDVAGVGGGRRGGFGGGLGGGFGGRGGGFSGGGGGSGGGGASGSW